MSPASVAKDLYRWNRRHIWLYILMFATITALFTFTLFTQPRSLQRIILIPGTIVALAAGAAFEHIIKSKKEPFDNYLARRDPAEFTREDLELLFRAICLVPNPIPQERDLTYARFLRHYCETQATPSRPAKSIARHYKHYRKNLQNLAPEADWNWLSRVLP